jgi:hypothetical protein
MGEQPAPALPGKLNHGLFDAVNKRASRDRAGDDLAHRGPLTVGGSRHIKLVKALAA